MISYDEYMRLVSEKLDRDIDRLRERIAAGEAEPISDPERQQLEELRQGFIRRFGYDPDTERATKRPRPLREVWKSTRLTRIEKVMAWLGWTRADIIRVVSCAWCGEDFRFEGETAADPPRFCSNNHKVAAAAARAKRHTKTAEIERRRLVNEGKKAQEAQATPRAETAPAPVKPPPPPEPIKAKQSCSCTNHMGTTKVRYPSNGAAAVGLMRRHIAHGKHRIYQCPTSDYWHITSKPEWNAA